MSWLDEEYLNFFFFSDEDDYKILLAAGKDASSSQNTTSYTNNSNSTGTNTTTQNNSNNTTGNNTTNTNTGNNTSTTNSTSTTSQPVKIHLLIVANTLISDIGTSTLVDVNNIVSEVTGISEVLGVSMNKMLISDKQFTKKNVENFLVGFSPGPNDVVIFMYSGHGYRFSNQTEKYPQLDMRYSEYQAMDDNSTMNLKQVYDELIKKGARLNIVLGDCCNSNVGFSRSVGSSFMASRSSVDPDFEKLKKLFIKSSGNIIAAGASPSEYSWCTMNNGGFFTTSFIGSLREEISKFKPEDNPDWGDILTNTTTGTRKKSDMCTECKPQNVVYDKYMKN